MYLFVYIFLLLSIIGLYSQLFMLQIAGEKSYEVTVGQSMYQWHESAFDLAKQMAITPAPDSVCALTDPDVEAPCAYVLKDPNGVVPAGYPRHFLPVGYNYNLKFRSLAYNVSGKNYVATFIDTGETRLGLTPAEVFIQVKRTSIPQSAYGQVQNGTCDAHVGRVAFTGTYVKPESGALSRICFPVPATMPESSVIFVSIL